MDITEMRDLTIDELNVKIKEFRAKLFDIRFKLATHQVENTAEIAGLRHKLRKQRRLFAKNKLRKNSHLLINKP